MTRILHWIRRHFILSGVAALVVAAVAYGAVRGGNDSDAQTTVTVIRGAAVEEVSVTGKVKAAEQVDLAFESAGTVATVAVHVGQEVATSTILATLSAGDLAAALRRSQASLSSAAADAANYDAVVELEKVALQEFKRGTRPEDLRVTEAAVTAARTALIDATNSLEQTRQKADSDLQLLYENVDEVLHEAFVKADEAVHKNILLLFTGSKGNEQLSFAVGLGQLTVDASSQKAASDRSLETLNGIIMTLAPGQPERDAALARARNELTVVRTFLDTLGLAVDNSSLSSADQQTYAGYVNTAQANTDTALGLVTDRQQDISSTRVNNAKSIQAAETTVNAAAHTLETRERELEVKIAGSSAEDIAGQEARVKQAQASAAAARARISQYAADVDSAVANFNKTVLRSPIAGTVTAVDIKAGEKTPASTPAISVMSAAQYEIEAQVPEVDIVKISLGDTAKVTLDAYGSDAAFTALVSRIDPAETVIEGVSTYTVVLQFAERDDRVKSGMTANIDIVTERRENVLLVPQRAVGRRDDGRYVRMSRKDGDAEERSVEVGVRSTDGNIEITNGLSEGDTILRTAD